MASPALARKDVLAFRFLRHQLDRPADSAAPTDVDVLDYGVQDTGTGSAWALAIRGARPATEDDVFLAWTLRGAPHAYRRADALAIATATAPFSERDAASRIFDASKKLRDAGIDVLDALKTVAHEERDIVRRPMVKGDVSTELTPRLDAAYVRKCVPCGTTHAFEQTFRLPALQGGLELEPGTSPPVLRRMKGLRAPSFGRLGGEATTDHHVVRNCLRFFGPVSVKAICTFLEAPRKDVVENLPDDAIEVTVKGADGDARLLLEADVDVARRSTSRLTGQVRLLGSHDPYLQLRDRDVLVPDPDRASQLWRTIGRPGALAVDGEVIGTYRATLDRKTLKVVVDPWRKLDRKTSTAVETEAERLAAHRGVPLGSVEAG